MKRLILLLCCFCRCAWGQEISWTTNCHQAYEESAKLNFTRANQLLQAERKVHPQNLVIPYVESQMDFIRCFISENKVDLDGLKKRNASRINLMESHKVKSPYQRLFIAEYNMQMAVGRLKFEEYVTGAYETRKAFKLLQENKKLYPDFKPTLRSLGFIHAFVGAAPKNFQWILNLLGFSGTVQQGLGELTDLLNATYKQPELDYLRDESIVLLTFLEMNLIRDKNNDLIRKRLNTIEDINHKPLIQFAKCVFHFANAENDSVISILSKRAAPPDAFRLNYLDYIEGIARLNSMDFTAEACFKKYVSTFTGMTFIRSAYQRMAWLRLLQGDMAGYKSYILLAGKKTSGNYMTDEDKQAKKESETNEIPNIYLLRSRLLFDGGYYTRSLAEIAGKPTDAFPLLRDKLEFTYRLARIFDKTNKKEKAIQYYEQTLNNGKNFRFYFAANSALQLGLIYEADNKTDLAEKYYKICINLPDHEYQNSLDQKAKAGLSRIGR